MIIELSLYECQQFSNILPVQGNLEILEIVDNIMKKVTKNVNEQTNTNEIIKIDFDLFEINFIKSMIKVLDRQQKINYNSLTLIKKFLKTKETENV